MKIEKIEDLDAWKESTILCEMIYQVTNTLPESEKYTLTKHLRASSRGIAANIAEGFGRYYYKENLRFYGIAKGCLNEVKSDINICFQIKYINQEKFDEIIYQINKTESILNGLMSNVLKRLNNNAK